MSDVDVVVLDIDGGELLTACLDSLFAQSLPPRRVIVVDNGSRVPVRERIAHDVTIIRHEENRGFAGGVNSATSDAPFLALVNNDVVLDRDWLRFVREAMERDEQLGAVQTIIRRPNGMVDGAGIDISGGTFRQIGYNQFVGSRLAVAWGVSATATLYRRAAITGPIFDERLFAYYEDVELSARLRRAGWRLCVLPVIQATHHGSKSAAVLPDAVRLRTRNRYLVARMHGIGSIGALLWEDVRLLLRGRSSLRGIWQGLTGTMSDER